MLLSKLKVVIIELPEFGGGTYFKSSQSGAKWMPIELTIVGGPYDKRKVWQNIFVDGAKTDQNGFSIAKRIGLETIKKMVDSHFALDMKDVSPRGRTEARQHQWCSYAERHADLL